MNEDFLIGEELKKSCDQCGGVMKGIKGSKDAICSNCGYKDSCCY